MVPGLFLFAGGIFYATIPGHHPAIINEAMFRSRKPEPRKKRELRTTPSFEPGRVTPKQIVRRREELSDRKRIAYERFVLGEISAEEYKMAK